MSPALEHLARLRASLEPREDLQLLYEQWLKQERWQAREQAMPLLVGCDPAQWPAYLADDGRAASEEVIWQLMSNELGIDQSDAIAVERLVGWAGAHEISLPPSFARIYEFVRKVVMSSSLAVDETPQAAADPEREIVLGAALAVVAKIPERCRDEYGFIDGAAITTLLLDSGSRWFPPSGPAMSREEMAALLDKWLE